ncbi:ABC transporter permease [Streptosporangium roseum]|uniref:ABC transporter permease n=1 Tax=Streptosporangium roseum TaxID=2001 RepID=UPI003330ECD4
MGTLIATELRLLARSAEFLAVTIGFPALFFLVMSEVFGDLPGAALGMSTYMMVSCAAFGAVTGSLLVGSRVALERRAGWNRQLRLTPLPGWSYVVAKAAVAMAVVLPALLLIFLVGGVIKDVELSAALWGQALAASWLGSLPFAVLGLLLGMAAGPETSQALGVAGFLLMGMFGGLFMPVETMPSVMAGFAHALPSFWMAENVRDLLAGSFPDLLGFVVPAAWFTAAAAAVVALYRRGTSRV